MFEDEVINKQIEEWQRESKGNNPFGTAKTELLKDLNLYADEQTEKLVEIDE